MKIFLQLPVLLLFYGIFNLQAQRFDWAKGIGGPRDDHSLEKYMAMDNDGNIYIAGNFSKGYPIDFDPGSDSTILEAAGNMDIYIAKYDSNGNFIWAKTFGDTATDRIYSIAIDTFTNTLNLAGVFAGVVDFDFGAGVSTLTSTGSAIDIDGFIARYDLNGGLIWAKKIRTGYMEILYLTFDKEGYVYATGDFQHTTDFDPGPGSAVLTTPFIDDAFVAKYDSMGNYHWAFQIGGSVRPDVGTSIIVDDSANVYVVGDYGETADFDPSPTIKFMTAGGPRDIFMAKYDSSGAYLWSVSLGGISNNTVGPVLSDDTGNIYISGSFNGTADLDPGPGVAMVNSGGTWQTFVVKYGRNHAFKWAFASEVGFSSMALSKAGDIYGTGSFLHSVDFDHGNDIHRLDVSDGRVFIARYDNGGNYINAVNFEAGGLNKILTYHKGIFVTGSFAGTADFNPRIERDTLVSHGEEDIFLARYYPCELSADKPTLTATASIACPFDSVTVSVVPSSNLRDADRWRWYYEDCGNHALGRGPSITLWIYPGLTVYARGEGCPAPGECDSFTISMYPLSESYEYDTICAGESFVFPDGTLAPDTLSDTLFIYYRVLTTPLGCDSFAYNFLTINSAYYAYDTVRICAGNAYTFPDGTTADTSVTHTSHYTTALGCDSNIITQLIVESYNVANTAYICAGDVYTFPDSTTSDTATVHTSYLTTTFGCDSVITTNLIVGSPSQRSEAAAICNGDIYTFPDGTTADTTVVHTSNLLSVAGCDSIIITQLNVNPVYQKDDSAFICQGDEHVFHDSSTSSVSGLHTSQFTTAAGCDSNITTLLTVTTMDVSASISGNVITVAESGAHYQWLDCNNSNQPVAGATAQSFAASVNGSYAVVVTRKGCDKTSSCYTITGVGIGNLSGPTALLYPNPNTGNFTLQFEDDREHEIIITDVLGKVVMPATSVTRRQEFSLNAFAEGVYFVCIRNGGVMKFNLLK